MPVMIVMLGPAGSGKTTDVRENLQGFTVLNADSIRHELTGDAGNQEHNHEVFPLLRSRLSTALRRGKNVVVDNTNTKFIHREKLYRIALGLGAEIEVRVMQTPLDECLRRNELRPKPVPPEVIHAQFDAFLQSLSELPDEPLKKITLVPCGEV